MISKSAALFFVTIQVCFFCVFHLIAYADEYPQNPASWDTTYTQEDISEGENVDWEILWQGEFDPAPYIWNFGKFCVGTLRFKSKAWVTDPQDRTSGEMVEVTRDSH